MLISPTHGKASTKRPRWDAAFRAEALRIASKSASRWPRLEYRPQAALYLADSGSTTLARRPNRGPRSTDPVHGQ
jgi:hypothetical protein